MVLIEIIRKPKLWKSGHEFAKDQKQGTMGYSSASGTVGTSVKAANTKSKEKKTLNGYFYMWAILTDCIKSQSQNLPNLLVAKTWRNLMLIKCNMSL